MAKMAETGSGSGPKPAVYLYLSCTGEKDFFRVLKLMTRLLANSQKTMSDNSGKNTPQDNDWRCVTLSMTLTSAPLETSICRHSMLFLAAAQCSGVSSSCQWYRYY